MPAGAVKRAMMEGPELKADGPALFIPTGSTLLNLALSNRTDGGWPVGKFANLIGDSSSGKTFLALTAFAEMARDVRFAKYRLIYDDAEAANEFNMAQLFGQGAAERVEPPAKDKDGDALNSDTVQDFQANLENALTADKPFLYILDSFDALTSEEEIDKVAKQMKARAEGEETAGTYGMEKAKKASQLFRMIKSRLRGTASSLIVISQTRDNINPMSFQKQTRAGGRALKFYACHELWTAIGGHIKKKVRGKDHAAGIEALVKITKNKITGKECRIGFPILYHYGIDDPASMLDYLLEYGVIEKRKKSPIIVLGDEQGTAEELVARMEEEAALLRRVRTMVSRTWTEIDQALKTNRRKYA